MLENMKMKVYIYMNRIELQIKTCFFSSSLLAIIMDLQLYARD